MNTLLENLSVEKYGAKLHINPRPPMVGPIILDVETDEHDNFVGMGWTHDGIDINYTTNLPKWLELVSDFIGHNAKADIKWLKSWGIDIKPTQIYGDTMLQSYCQNPTREKHGLKYLAKILLDMDYPEYKSIVGKGKSKLTLDKQPIEVTANYCGLDVLATFRLYHYFQSKLTESQKAIYETVEMPIMRLLYEMELKGINVDVNYLKELQTQFGNDINAIKLQLGSDINWNSPKQVGEKLGLKSTNRKVLVTVDKPEVKTLLEYRELSKLKSTYVDAFLEQQKDGKIYTTFNQIIDTGRLSSHGPNLQNIPTRTERGDLLRRVFVPSDSHVFIDADYDQIEYRLLAHFSGEPKLIQAFKEGEDVHESTAKLLGVSRYLGKTLNFAAIYGAQPKKITQTVNTSGQDKITEDEAKEFLDLYWSKLPRVKYWIEKTKEDARRSGCFRTLSGQYFKLKYLYDKDRLKRWYSERQAVNGTIQGSAAFLMKRTMLELKKSGLTPLLQVHDELLFEGPMYSDRSVEGTTLQHIKDIMENVVQLSVPLKVSIGIGKSWKESKDNAN